MKVGNKTCVVPGPLRNGVVIYATNMVPEFVENIPIDILDDKEKLDLYIKDKVDKYEELRKEQAENFGELD
jgi:hypothetical protein